MTPASTRRSSASWTGREEVRAALEEDAAAARAPVAAARALDHKLSGPAGGRRYSAPTYLLRREGERRPLRGRDPRLQPGRPPPTRSAIANLDPELPRRPPPGSVDELLEWAPYPLATAEVVEITGLAEAKARAALAAVAEPIAAGADLYWRLPA